jgi:hypothetical protein
MVSGVLCGERPAAATQSSSSLDRLLIVAPESFASALEDFRVTRSQQLGQPVEWLALESLAGLPGVDAPEKLKRELYRRWKAGDFGSVLLVGDVDVLPVRFMVLDRVAKGAFDTAFYASDLYYADLAHADGSFDDWNAHKEGIHAQYFGEVHGEHHKDGPINRDGISYIPEIAVGRWPVSTPAAAEAVAQKTIRHQREVLSSRSRSTDPGESQPHRSADGAQSGKSKPATDGQSQTQQSTPVSPPILSFFFSGGWIDNTRQARELTCRLRASGQWSVDEHGFYLADRIPSSERVAQSLAALPAAIFHTGHGQAWGWEGCFDAAVLAKTPRTARPPLLFSIGCSTARIATQPPYDGYFDTSGQFQAGTNQGQVFESFPPPPAALQTGAANASSLAEDAVRQAEGGAIVAIGCVTGSQPCAHTLLDGFVDAARRAPEQSAGAWWQSALCHYVEAERLMDLKPGESWYPPSIFFQGMKFVYLGDPTVRLR